MAVTGSKINHFRNNMDTQNKDFMFFYENCGFSYDPKTETQEEGKQGCAKALEIAEKEARNRGMYYDWDIDPIEDSSSFKKGKPYSLWLCRMYDSTEEMVASLGGIDFGRDGTPYGKPYKRVIEAELAQEALG